MITLGRLGMVVTIAAWAAYIVITILSQLVNRGFHWINEFPFNR